MVDRNRKSHMQFKDSFDISFSRLGYVLKQIQTAIKFYGPDAELRKYNELYDDGEYIGIFAMTPETDQEMAKRIAQEEGRESAAEAREKAEFERLEKKYGGK